ncbi:MAG: transketolase family protein, partial [Clostridia bacterium]
MELRKVYAETMAELMKKNDKIVILDADLSKAGGTAPLYKAFPDRTYDVGICESNMTSMAAGLSAYGFIPVIHSFAPFVTRRNFDQIAVSVSYARRNVKIIGLDPGITATLNGGTHMCFEDIASLRSLPNVLIFDAV